jgi:hypothetical protein
MSIQNLIDYVLDEVAIDGAEGILHPSSDFNQSAPVPSCDWMVESYHCIRGEILSQFVQMIRRNFMSIIT